MKKYILTLALTIALTMISTASFAQTSKIITLKDGSVLKGKVIELNDGAYTLETSNLGSITIPESDILSITAPQNAASALAGSTGSGSLEKAQLKTQVEAMQGDILSDPELMIEIQNILADEEVQKMLADPKLLSDVMTYDQEKIEQNDNVRDLMQNPKIQNLIDKIHQKMPSQK